MNSKLRYILAPILVGAITFSCDQKDVEEVTPAGAVETSITSLATSGNLIFEENFEDSSPFSDAVKLQVGSWDYAFNQATNPVYSGAKSGRFELRDTDPAVSGGTRAEALVVDFASNKNRWYSFAAYFPKADFEYDSGNEVINQWYQQSGTTQATTLRIMKDRFYLQTGNNSSSLEKIDLGSVTKDSWHQFVFHFVHSYGSDGLIEVWHNGTKILTHKGGNMYNTRLPNWKMGIYKSKWNSGTTDTKKRVVYFDNVRVGNENATLAEMSTGDVATPAPAPTPEPTPAPAPTPEITPVPTPGTSNSQIPSFTLINAHTEKPVRTMTNGTVISFADMGTKKLNFRADVDPSFTGSVKFQLSGAMNYNLIDNAAPHALYGDNGSGNYYYGALTMPVGTYTLVATPYSGKDGSGTAGAPATITFTVTDGPASNVAPAPTPAPTPAPAPALTPVPAPTPTPEPAPAPSTSQISSITFVDAHIEKGIMKVNNGDILSFSKLGTKKFNFRADVDPAVTGSVKFELRGAMSYDLTDNAAPFSLYGDNGSGNYYYGALTMPVGNYTLVATPYSGEDGTGTAGTPMTITFSVQD